MGVPGANAELVSTSAALGVAAALTTTAAATAMVTPRAKTFLENIMAPPYASASGGSSARSRRCASMPSVIGLEVTLYSASGCHLCVDARAELERLRDDLGFTLVEVEIDRVPELE